ncbi:Aldo/keto reductase [Metschnikowia bicuspidata var. bicuspidata NRRL YB-4993]|uniref:2-dehydropantolactone reductase n=1 Tax=Metschnikowia bicuspidata var. bicuspidata NRRL YB-4993 TaxID=869754 RepID=A0A1A0HF47_9ASCO|nr:Aldo/keto reductase [Metschnikowia bicuspidata var. bicuspidata NRRL YB-4993]OBA22605.1 Aldo/keto reductase [Metschnikowia bicuspidata var. bicuspidata NRRL YB-4993]
MPGLQDNTKTYTLNDGHEIPAVGLGTWRATSEDNIADVVESALRNGYRHIDTAAIYGNEEDVGKGIKASGVPREEIFVTTKLWNSDHKNVRKAFEESLRKLQLDYVDLYLIHWPLDGDFDDESANISDCFSTYIELQKLKQEGKAKSIGVSNFSKGKIESLLAHPEVTIKPAVNQIEAHPLLPQYELYDYLKKNDIYIEAYSPLGSADSPLFKEKNILRIAQKNDVEPAQVLISWAIQRDTVVLPKSVKASRLVSNIKTFELSDEDFAVLNELSEVEGVVRTNNPLPALFKD